MRRRSPSPNLRFLLPFLRFGGPALVLMLTIGILQGIVCSVFAAGKCPSIAPWWLHAVLAGIALGSAFVSAWRFMSDRQGPPSRRGR
jgi:hypothetical protein